MAIAAAVVGYNDFSLSHDLTRPHDQRFMQFYGWELLIVTHYPSRHGGHRHCGSRDMMLLAVQRQDFICSPFNPPLLFISKSYGMPY